MKIEDQDLLLKDLCGRLPYWVKCIVKSDWYIGVISSIESQYGVVTFDDGRQEEICDIKPCLYPLSSMTEEQEKELHNIQGVLTVDFELEEYKMVHLFQSQNAIDWLNKNYFDYRGLIEAGLAIDATSLNVYKEETK